MEQNMHKYGYFSYGETDAYGQPKLSTEIVGEIKMAIGIASQQIQDSVAYSGTQYTALTHAEVDDSMVIQYGDDKLKVLYVNPLGKYKQVYLARM
jgi:hypothetical protein